MKSKIVAVTLLASTAIIGYSNTSFAEACYEAGGTVTTENITSTLQMGNIILTLRKSNGATVFKRTGSLVGNITGTNGIGSTLLSHTAKFSNGKGNMFVTNGDEAVLAPPYVRDTLDDGSPCSFWIHETISNIASGTGFFKKVTFVEIFANGYISNPPVSG